MLIERFEERGLSHYSYAVGSPENGQIAIIDPGYDAQIYLDFAEKNGFIISHVFETHIHADYASGARHLAARARASLILSGYDKGEKYEVNFPHKSCFDGDKFKMGKIQIEVIHTPGHTPEHISFLVHENNEPKALFSGDFLLVGAVGRPDLIGEESSKPLAKKLYSSIKEKLAKLPGTITVYPAHGAGSFCGGGMGSSPFSTLMHERMTNPYLAPRLTEKQFMELLFSNIPVCPEYFFRMKVHNTTSERNKLPVLKSLDVEAFDRQIKKGHVVIDLRDQKTFSADHIPGSICIGEGAKVGFWASWVVPYDTPLLIVTSDPTHIQEAVTALSQVGLFQVEGYLKGGLEAWKLAQKETQKAEEISPSELKEDLKSGEAFQVVDVRSIGEWMVGHIPGSHHVPCHSLTSRMKDLPKGKLVFICAGGYRSILATSLAMRQGVHSVAHVPGGIHACQAVGLPLRAPVGD